MSSFFVARGENGARSPLLGLVAILLLLVALLALGIYLVGQSPYLPYNVRELLGPGQSILGGAALGAFTIFAFGPPALLGVYLINAPLTRIWVFPVGILAHAALTYIGSRYSVPLESIHDIVGSPVWGTDPNWERLFRFSGLMVGFSVPVAGAAAGFFALTGAARPSRFGRWLVFAAILLPASHWIVVEMAATDNLVELMAGSGSVVGSLSLALWVFLVAFGASVVSARLSSFFGSNLATLLALLLILPLAYGAADLGTNQDLAKYGQRFSALQFLLSPDRTSYLSGGDLLYRYLVAHFLIQALLAIGQTPVWYWLAHRYRPFQRRQSHGNHNPAQEDAPGPA